MLTIIKELARQCDIHTLDGYIVSLYSDHDGLMRVTADQFDKFCSLIVEKINNNEFISR